MRVFLYLRKTEDWRNTTFGQIAFDSDKPKYFRIWAYWNHASSIPWFELRARLSDIARLASPLPILECPAHEVAQHMAEDDWVIPTDDDDWLHPQIEQFIEDEFQTVEFGHWNSIVNQTVHHYSYHAWHPLHANVICSNSYCVRGSLLKRLNPAQSHGILQKHFKAYYLGKKFGTIKSCMNLEMSCYNWHPGSYSAMNKIKSISDAALLFPKKRRRSEVLPQRWKWADPYLTQVVDLIRNIEVSREPRQPKLL